MNNNETKKRNQQSEERSNKSGSQSGNSDTHVKTDYHG